MVINGKKLAEATARLNQAKRDWHLLDDGSAFATKSSLLQPVFYGDRKAMLKIPLCDEERRGAALMVCWNGSGAVKVLEHDDGASLMERATGTRSLREMVLNGQEEKANNIICGVTPKLHKAPCCQNKDLVPLPIWFRSLEPASEKCGGILRDCSKMAAYLLSDPNDIVALHGDIHYENILDSSKGTWLAIDPKALLGERAFDFANLFCNPTPEIAMSPVRLEKQTAFVAREAGLDLRRLLQWIVAWSGLSAAWMLEDGENPVVPLTVAQNALVQLGKF